MKKLLFKPIFAIVISVLSILAANAQDSSVTQYSAYVFPSNPTAKDSVYVAYTYVSNDGCPDYYLVIDSVVNNKIYVNKKEIISDRACTMVISKFTAKLNLGLVLKNTQIYFEGKLINTIIPRCIMDKTGVVVAGTNACEGQLFIQEYSPLTVIHFYSFENKTNSATDNTVSGLKVGDKVKFGGYLIKNESVSQLCNIVGFASCWEKVIDTVPCVMDRKGEITGVTEKSSILKDLETQELFEINVKLVVGSILQFKGVKVECITTPCYNIVECYKLVNVPTTPCVKDKRGVVVAGKGLFANRLFIEVMTHISAYIPVYIVQENIASNAMRLKVGDEVKFGGYLQSNDSAASVIYPLKIVGVATCWEVIPDSTTCVMDRKGEITGVTETSSILKDNSTGEIFQINKVKLTIGTIIIFKGNLIQCITTPCYNIVECYQIVSTPPVPCVMDKTGVVVEGIGDCTGQLFIEVFSPAAIALKQLYAFKNNTISLDGSILPVLKPGDKVKFGGYSIRNDSNKIRLCNIIGVATCWKAISDSITCVKDKKGVITALTENASLVKDISTGDIFAINGVKLAVGTTILFKGVKIVCITTPCYNIVECYQIISNPPTPCVLNKTGVVVPGIDGCTGRLFIQEITDLNTPQLYTIQNYIATSSDGSTISKLQAGDKVKFGGYLTKNDSTKSILCYTVGVATCYELIASENTYSLAGKVIAGNELMKSGIAVLFRKGEGKAVASNTITDGTFTFKNIPEAAYTVYIIPDISIYKNYMPTFYINKFLYNLADYIKLNRDINDIVVYLTNFDVPVGKGKIYGNIYFETEQLKDSILAAKGSLNAITSSNRTAENATVVLYDNLFKPVAWTISDAGGNYSFENLSLNTYRVVSETASAKAEMTVNLSTSNSEANANLILKSPEEKTGVDQIEEMVLNFYPNPVADKLIINVKENMQMNIYSAMGQLLLNRSLESGVNILDVSAINKGIYFAKIGNTTIRMIKK